MLCVSRLPSGMSFFIPTSFFIPNQQIHISSNLLNDSTRFHLLIHPSIKMQSPSSNRPPLPSVLPETNTLAQPIRTAESGTSPTPSTSPHSSADPLLSPTTTMCSLPHSLRSTQISSTSGNIQKNSCTISLNAEPSDAEKTQVRTMNVCKISSTSRVITSRTSDISQNTQMSTPNMSATVPSTCLISSSSLDHSPRAAAIAPTTTLSPSSSQPTSSFTAPNLIIPQSPAVLSKSPSHRRHGYAPRSFQPAIPRRSSPLRSHPRTFKSLSPADAIASRPASSLFHPPTSSFVFGLNANLPREQTSEEPFIFGSPQHRVTSDHHNGAESSVSLGLCKKRGRTLRASRLCKSIVDDISDIEKAIYFARTVFSPTCGTRKP